MNAAVPASAVATAPPGGMSHYIRLFDVQIQHDYYNAAGGACPDFAVAPAPECARLMRMLGMVFKDLGTGFAVLIDQAAVAPASRYIAARFLAGGPGLTWLTFLLTPTNPGFIGLTQLPITLNPMQQNLHASNLTGASAGVLTLDGAKPATAGTSATQPTLYAVKGPVVAAPTPDGATVVLTDLSGAPVICPVSLAGGGATFRLTGGSYGLYTVTTTPTSGKPTSMSFIYAPTPPPTLCVLDLVLAQPAGGTGDAAAFPFTATAASSSGVSVSGPQPVTLTLPFTARETQWRYYVVAQGRAGGVGGAFGADLQITGRDQVTGKPTTFTRGADVLPNGDPAALFTADDLLPLQQRSTCVCSLNGQRLGANGARDAITVERLPTAPPAPVWPAQSGDAISGTSEIYVYV